MFNMIKNIYSHCTIKYPITSYFLAGFSLTYIPLHYMIIYPEKKKLEEIKQEYKDLVLQDIVGTSNHDNNDHQLSGDNYSESDF